MPHPTGTVMVDVKSEHASDWKAKETVPLDKWPGAMTLSRDRALTKYGGQAARKARATGFFRTEKIEGRWWLVDPEGGLYVHVAVASVQPVEGDAARKELERRFGTERAWTDATAAMLKECGFNGTGAWSSDDLLAPARDRLAATRLCYFLTEFARQKGLSKPGRGHADFVGSVLPVFDPEFAPYCKRKAGTLAAFRDDPWLIGYFSDNELPFADVRLENYLALPEGDPNRTAAVDWLKEHLGPDAPHEGFTADVEDSFLAFVAETYFKTVSEAIRASDPNHLYLGCRFHGRTRRMPGLFRACGPYVDAVSFNLYNTWTPDPDMLATWSADSGKPILITEFYAKGADSGLANTSGAGFLVKTQADRGLFYQNFTLALLRSHNVIGWHWFRYADNDPDVAGSDVSNHDSNKGIVSNRYVPYPTLMESMKQVNTRVYPLIDYFEGKPTHR